MNTETQAALPMNTYEQKLAALVSINMMPFEVSVRSDRFKVNGVFKFATKQEAFNFANLMIHVGRETHDEKILKAKYIDGYSGLEQTFSEDEVFDSEGSIFGYGWKVDVMCIFPRLGKSEDFGHQPKWLHGGRFGANRVALPTSKVFVHYWGRDCDGYGWSNIHQYANLHEAAEGFDGVVEGLDGTMGWEVVTKSYYETDGF